MGVAWKKHSLPTDPWSHFELQTTKQPSYQKDSDKLLNLFSSYPMPPIDHGFVVGAMDCPMISISHLCSSGLGAQWSQSPSFPHLTVTAHGRSNFGQQRISEWFGMYQNYWPWKKISNKSNIITPSKCMFNTARVLTLFKGPFLITASGLQRSLGSACWCPQGSLRPRHPSVSPRQEPRIEPFFMRKSIKNDKDIKQTYEFLWRY